MIKSFHTIEIVGSRIGKKKGSDKEQLSKGNSLYNMNESKDVLQGAP